MISSNSVKADLIRVVTLGSKNYKVQRVNETTNVATDLVEFNQPSGVASSGSFLDSYNRKLYMAGDNDGYTIYDIDANTITKVPYGLTGQLNNFVPWEGKNVIKKNEDGTIQIGGDANDVDITSEGLSVDGDPIISKKANGELHIGKNSWITKEENGRQKVYAKDAAGNPIPIDYTNGTKLLINGRDIEQSINNVGALSAALTGLPTVPTETALACGLGAGTHGGDFAFSGGCASRVNEKLSFNYAASMTMPGQEYAGEFEDSFSARAGFVWQLGKAKKPTQISMNQKEEIDLKLSQLENDNEKLKNENEKIISKNTHLETSNNEIISQNKKLLARLEKLEKIAFKFQGDNYKFSKSISE